MDIGAIANNWWFNHFRKHLSDEQKAALEAIRNGECDKYYEAASLWMRFKCAIAIETSRRTWYNVRKCF